MNGIILYQSKYGATKNTRSGFRRKQTFPESKQSRQEFQMSGNMTPSFSAGRWASGIDSPNRKTLVCVENGRIVGKSSFCSSRFEQFSGWGEVISLYLLPEYMGKGDGKRLLETSVTELQKLGYANVFLWALEENSRARHFYERFGFSPTSDFLETEIGGKDLREVRYIF